MAGKEQSHGKPQDTVQNSCVACVVLHLIGKPKLTIDGVDHRLSRPVVFELLAVIVVAGEPGVSRTGVIDVLWSHLTPANARNQLRGTLAKLRADLAASGLAEAFDLESQTLRAVANVQCDLARFLSDPPANLEDLEPFTKRIAETWPPEHWYRLSDQVATTLANQLEPHFRQDRLGDLRPLLERAVASYPFNSRLSSLLASTYKLGGDESAASETIISFETAWVDRFGHGDIPKLETLALSPGKSPEEAQLPSPARRNRKSLGGTVLVVLAAIAGIWLSLPPKPPDRLRLDISLVEKRTKVVDGYTFLLRKFRIANAFSDNHRILYMSINEKDFAVTLGTEAQVIVREDQSVQHNFPVMDFIQEQSGGKVDFRNDKPSIQVVGIHQGTFQAVPGWPKMAPPSILSDGTTLIRRLCRHPYICHQRLWHFYDGAEHPVFPDQAQPQVIVTGPITATTVYGKFSFGKKKGWRYHTFSYSIAERQFRFLDIPPVVAALHKDVLVCFPEETTVINGDYDTHPNGELVVLNLKTQTKVQRMWGKPGLAPTVKFLPPYIADIQPFTTQSSKLQFLDDKLRPRNPFPELAGDFRRVESLSNHGLVLVPFQKMERPRDFWIITREEAL